MILVGGSTRIPIIESMLTNYFDGRPPIKVLNPDEAVAQGATIFAMMLEISQPTHPPGNNAGRGFTEKEG